MTQPIAMALHGGAGVLMPGVLTCEDEQAIHAALLQALKAGVDVLEKGGSSLDAVQASVVELEECPWFNAGKGAVFTHAGDHELDAAIMNGANREAGAVAGVHHVRNPICGARAVLEHSEHVLLAGAGADLFLSEQAGLEHVSNDWYDTPLRRRQWAAQQQQPETVLLEPGGVEKKFGTVGAVALDSQGHVAAATSTGGITNKRYGRVGDSPLIGSGTWADDRSAAISATGHGEFFMRTVVAHNIASRIRLVGSSLADACEQVVQGELKELGGNGGVVAVTPTGETVLSFNTPGMYRAWLDADGGLHTAIYAEDDCLHRR
ncbi:isoaspartyl peptidase/L-asparaginase family protein [Pseudomonas fragi]|jgi:L-asparaginase / beta-aspartyl-peptidase|uniref:Isoaspartyl peptidase n=1 Tax=Pseudomonas fragi TaxID=296 RepID=A0A9Q5FR38_PSEFR|nr:isoaspartyl peptidase/L-asparaginase [Pseudomonas fragi]MBM1202610.1 isoaspartyl peptidase/L-asparaginase [Pseudomonas fragi]NNB24804.1 isoaspartyl peptidase/L-asparaginase [Pseudomonas fragi]NNB36689.1 isoaspartyl peptidase/L-asparaginase [Pseudomonas fragi]NNB52071.1 isoaspartyl peptidase/L-asparaginase [Pseudomonas fragi]PAA02937.1 beta-aspartyl-peptidase [Pseudomonas fragi]